MLRNLLAVLAGIAIVVGLSTATDAVMHGSGVFPPAGQPMADRLWMLAIVYRSVYQVAGGYVAAWLARSMTPVYVLAAVGLVASAAGVAATWNGGPAYGPRWYALLLVALAVPTVWLGGWLRRKRGPLPRRAT